MRFERTRSESPGPTPSTCRTIAIDGPVAVGKTTVGRLLAQRLGYLFVDTGALYRALTWKALQNGIDPQDDAGLADLASRTSIQLLSSEHSTTGYQVLVEGADVTDKVRTPAVESSVSLVSLVPAVRRILVEKQRQMALENKVVMVGRDIATVVLPDADLKVFLTASPRERAQRRYRELKASGKERDFESVLQEMTSRDSLDSTRKDSPLKIAANSQVVDTDMLSLEEVVDRVQALARGQKCC
ncbi:MAG: (d)CMP kinase [Dehalococcoidia bacterium]|nr:(d)CMP kinase [Dehalococcoidia bacterium]